MTATPVTEPATTIAARRHIRSGWVSPSHTWLISAMIGKEMASAMPQTNITASPRPPSIPVCRMVKTSETGSGLRGRWSISMICSRARSLTPSTSSLGAIGSPTRTSTGE